ncbi:hypothetical protein GJ496_010823 [Pomphorhynchus laevis]|nr:hypothetical protein GJ496_010823 [Pomphorhynchus laevis]
MISTEKLGMNLWVLVLFVVQKCILSECINSKVILGIPECIYDAHCRHLLDHVCINGHCVRVKRSDRIQPITIHVNIDQSIIGYHLTCNQFQRCNSNLGLLCINGRCVCATNHMWINGKCQKDDGSIDYYRKCSILSKVQYSFGALL